MMFVCNQSISKTQTLDFGIPFPYLHIDYCEINGFEQHLSVSWLQLNMTFPRNVTCTCTTLESALQYLVILDLSCLIIRR